MIGFLTLLLSCQLAGELAVAATGLPIPGPVCGMALLFAGLLIFGLPDALAQVGEALLGNLSLLFVPAGVGVILHARLMAQEWLPIAASLILSTLATIVVTALMMNRFGPAPPSEPDQDRDKAP
jgi:holin-like protein